MMQLPLLEISLRTRNSQGNAQVWDPVRKIWVLLTPEEHVRQLVLNHLITGMAYPAALMAVERGLNFGHTSLRFDIAVFHRDSALPWMLAECKSPETRLTDATLQQLLQYHSKLPECRYWLLTNGVQTFCADARDPRHIRWLDELPAYEL